MGFREFLRRYNKFLVRLSFDPKLQYRTILAVGLPSFALFFAMGRIPLAEFIESIAFVVLFPVVLHRVIRAIPDNRWRPRTIEGKLDQMAWRLGLGEHDDSDPGPRVYVGDFLDDPRRLEVYLHPSFELVESDDRSEVWRSDELRAVLRRDALRVELHSAEDEEAFASLVAAVLQRRLLE